MRTNHRHPDYDAALELLVTLPRQGHPAPLNMLAADLGYARAHDVLMLVEQLRQRGYAVETTLHLPDGICASIADGSWSAAQADGLDYWQRVYR